MNKQKKILEMIAAGILITNADSGLVYSCRSNTPSKPLGSKTKKDYLRTCINHNGESFYVFIHVIIWLSIYGEYSTDLQIDHKDGNKQNNSISNLSLVTGEVNMKRAAANGLTNGGWKDGKRNQHNGQFLSKKAAGRLLDGVEHNAFPDIKTK